MSAQFVSARGKKKKKINDEPNGKKANRVNGVHGAKPELHSDESDLMPEFLSRGGLPTYLPRAKRLEMSPAS